MNRKITISIILMLSAVMYFYTCCSGSSPDGSINCQSPGPSPSPGTSLRNFLVLPSAANKQALIDLISGAKTRIYMTIYLLTDHEIMNALATAYKNNNKLDLKIMVEPVAGSHETGQKTIDKLGNSPYNIPASSLKFTNSNIPAESPKPSSQPPYALTHEKSIVIDDTGVIMTCNMSYSAFNYNREFIFLDTNPADVEEIVSVFNADWNRTTFAPTAPSLVWSNENSRTKIDGIIKSAKTNLDIYAEEVRDEEQTNLLIAAVNNKVNVRLLTPPSDQTTDIMKLQNNNVQIRFPSPLYIHAKMFVADNKTAFIGSENISTQSLDRNRELGVILTDPSIISLLKSTFQYDWENAATNRN